HVEGRGLAALGKPVDVVLRSRHRRALADSCNMIRSRPADQRAVSSANNRPTDTMVGQIIDQTFEQVPAVGAAEQLTADAFGTRHQPRHIALLIQDAGDTHTPYGKAKGRDNRPFAFPY